VHSVLPGQHGVRFLAGLREFSFIQYFQTNSGAQWATYSVGYGDKAVGPKADNSPLLVPSSRTTGYIYIYTSPCNPLCPGQGPTIPFVTVL
jgi:hypothetical protein